MEKLHNLIRERISFEYSLVSPVSYHTIILGHLLLDDDVFFSFVGRLILHLI